MTVHGDTTYIQESLARELLECEVDLMKKISDPLVLAKTYVCLAHDWSQIHMEEEANRLLEKAEKVSPGYFKGQMLEDIENDAVFNLLVKSLISDIGWILISRLDQMGKNE